MTQDFGSDEVIFEKLGMTVEWDDLSDCLNENRNGKTTHFEIKIYNWKRYCFCKPELYKQNDWTKNTWRPNFDSTEVS